MLTCWGAERCLALISRPHSRWPSLHNTSTTQRRGESWTRTSCTQTNSTSLLFVGCPWKRAVKTDMLRLEPTPSHCTTCLFLSIGRKVSCEISGWDSCKTCTAQQWTHWDLNPGPSACEADVMPLHHVPLDHHQNHSFWISSVLPWVNWTRSSAWQAEILTTIPRTWLIKVRKELNERTSQML